MMILSLLVVTTYVTVYCLFLSMVTRSAAMKEPPVTDVLPEGTLIISYPFLAL